MAPEEVPGDARDADHGETNSKEGQSFRPFSGLSIGGVVQIQSAHIEEASGLPTQLASIRVPEDRPFAIRRHRSVRDNRSAVRSPIRIKVLNSHGGTKH